MITVTVITAADDLNQLVAEINQAAWDHANEMSAYDVPGLAAYLARQDTVFVACHAVTAAGRTLLGMASARVEHKPYGHERWLYVDEVDVCADQRRRGAGKALMHKLFAVAKDAGCEEVWLGAERDNHAANALYQALAPAEVTPVTGYTYATTE